MIIKEQIDKLTIKGELALVVVTLSELNDQFLKRNERLSRFINELRRWLNIPVVEITVDTSVRLYEEYSDKFYAELCNESDTHINNVLSLCYNLFLFALASMEGGEYTLYPDKGFEPTSDVVEQDRASFTKSLNTAIELLKDYSFKKKLMDVYNNLKETNAYSEDNAIGNCVDL